MNIPKMIKHKVTDSHLFDAIEARVSTEAFVVHSSETKDRENIGTTQLHERCRGAGWTGIGYHFVINRGGDIITGRPIEKKGSHTPSLNDRSIGICLAGGKTSRGNLEANYTPEQYDALYALLNYLIALYRETPDAVLAISDMDPLKSSNPGFSVYDWYVTRLRTGTKIMKSNHKRKTV